MTEITRQVVRKGKLSDQGKEGDEHLHVVPDIFVELAANGFRSSESYEQRRLVGSLKETTAEDIQFDDGRFLSVDLSKTRWHNLHLGRTALEKCDLANARWTNPHFDQVQLQKCRGTGLQFLDLRSKNSRFLDSKLNLAAFHGSKFRGDRFENCDLRETNFEAVDLVDVVFRNCDLRSARFPNCSLRNVDLRGSHLAGMHIPPDQLRGACIDAAQLPDVAAIMGLVVRPFSEREE